MKYVRIFWYYCYGRRWGDPLRRFEYETNELLPQLEKEIQRLRKERRRVVQHQLFYQLDRRARLAEGQPPVQVHTSRQ